MIDSELILCVALFLSALGIMFYGIGKGFENWGKKANCCDGCDCYKKKEMNKK